MRTKINRNEGQMKATPVTFQQRLLLSIMREAGKITAISTIAA